MPDLSDKAATLACWQSRNGKWQAELWRNYAGAYIISERKAGKPIGQMTRPSGFFADDNAALTWGREIVPQVFDVQMKEIAV